tara:strand:+ start:5049 stop:5912 length:864 start_codon:yes stop_codon:yes gene_type:complete
MPSDYTELEDPSVIHEEILMPSTIETVDFAVFDWLDKRLNLFATKNSGWEKVPVMWVGAERAFYTKNNKDLKNSNDVVTFPVITLERTSMVKDLQKKGGIFGNIPRHPDVAGGSLTIAKKIKQDKTSNFANADTLRKRGQINFPRKNKKVVVQTVTIPMPIYVEMNYSINIITEYQQQMNELLTPFATTTNSLNFFRVGRDGHEYDALIQSDFSFENNASNLAEEERKFKTKVDVKVLGYLVGEDKNQTRPKIVVRENAVEVKIPRERVIVGDENTNIENDGFYRDR